MKSKPVIFVSSPFASDAIEEILGFAAYSHKILALKLIPALEKHVDVRYVKNEQELNFHLVLLEKNAPSEYVFIYVGPPEDSWTSARCRNIILFTWEFPNLPLSDFKGLYVRWAEKLSKFEKVVIPNRLLEACLTNLGIRYEFVPIGKILVNESRMSLNVGLELLSKVTALKFINPSDLEFKNSSIRGENQNRFNKALTRLLNKIQRLYFETKLDLITPSALYRIFRNQYHKYSNRLVHTVYKEPDGFVEVDNLALELYGKVVVSAWLNFSDERKNFRILIQAFNEAFNNHQNVVLVIKIIGGPSEVDKVRSFVSNLNYQILNGLPPIVLVTKALEEELLEALRTCSAIYLNTSSAEGICMPVLEHAANGVVPVIPRNSAFIDYFTNDFHGFYEVDRAPTHFPGDPNRVLATSWCPPIFFSLVETLKLVAKLDFSEEARLKRAELINQDSEEAVMSLILALIGERRW
jgi:glycosyltransferase involved in cell wall biosynthesis